MSSSKAVPSAAERFRAAGLAFTKKLAKFGVVGAGAYILDVGIFNLLCYWGAEPVLAGEPFLAKVISTAVATVAAWLGNRYWTFRRTRRENARRELVLYVVMCMIGLGISLGCLWVSHKLLGLTSPLADNISANVVGLGVATAFRFWSYQRFVFTTQRPDNHSKHSPSKDSAYAATTFNDGSPALSEG